MPVARPRLNVEGKNDLYAIANLVEVHGIEFTKDQRVPEIHFAGDVVQLLDGIEEGVKFSTDRAVGFVLDADAPIVDRWRSVRDRLLRAAVDTVPESPPAEGFIGVSSRFKSRVGVWLMPDNQHDGDLESFLRMLIRVDDATIEHAEEATARAKALGAPFAEVDHRKAILHTWLAWRAEPGRPYGTAISAQYFEYDAELATRFVDWYARLFGLSAIAGP